MGDIIVRDSRASAVVEARQVDDSPAGLVRLAIERGADVAQIAQLLELRRDAERDEARKAHAAAMSAFRASLPRVAKDRMVSIRGGPSYRHVDLATLLAAVTEPLAAVGLSVGWSLDQSTAGEVAVTCQVAHEAGHVESVTVVLPLDTGRGRNALQQVGSTITYGRRYTLECALGIAAHGEDDDGHMGAAPGEPARAPAGPPPAPRPTTAQREELEALMLRSPNEARSRVATLIADVATEAEAARLIARLTQRLELLEVEAPAACAHTWGGDGACGSCGEVCEHPDCNRWGVCAACGARVPGADVSDGEEAAT